jgi:tRNA A-37 threonylcarbamoyl transferase component Bud32
MPETTASASRSGLMQSIFPRFDEAVSPEFYRLSGRLRAITNGLFIAANLVLAPQLGALGFDRDVHLRTLIAFLSIHAIDLVLGIVLWRGRFSLRTQRRLTYASIVLETAATVTASWVYGSVNSYFMAVELVFILMYRLAFDFRTGLAAFVLILAGQWAVVIAEVAGVLPAQPIGAHEIDKVYVVPLRQIGSMVYLSIVFVLTFVVANWAVARMRHKDIAIRILRESLYRTDRGQIGRHTGRTLRDTYTVGSLLGTGGMGEVYAGTHIRTRRKVAIKILHPHLIADSTVLSRFRREAEVTGKLGSEHIVGVIDVDEDDGQPFLVLELMDGESLAARIAAQGPLALEEIADIVEQIAAGLDVAHKAGVIHRDLKPENLFLCPRPDGGVTVKILDFGVSKIRGDATALTHEVAIVGTPDFMSPEQAVGNADKVDAGSDVFSLGGVAYNAITGRRPFEATSVPALLRQICDEEPPAIAELRPEVPVAVADVIAVAMAKQATERYASAIDVARDLRAAVAGALDAGVTLRAQQITRGKPAGARIRREAIDPTDHTQPA